VGILRGRALQNKPKLLDQVRDVIRRKHFGIRSPRIPNALESRLTG
jgi:hypothetical protein